MYAISALDHDFLELLVVLEPGFKTAQPHPHYSSDLGHKGAFTPAVNASLAWMAMWRHLVAWLRELHSHQAAVQSGQIWPSLLVADLLLQWVVFEDHENTFPCSVTSLVDTRKQIAYPPHKPTRVVKLNDGAASPSATSRVNCRPRTVFFLRCSTTVLNFAKLELTNAEITAPLSL